MPRESKTTRIQSMVPSVEQYVQKVAEFYQQHIQQILHKIDNLIKISQELSDVPQHLRLQLSYLKEIPKATQQEHYIECFMIGKQIEQFLQLREQVLEANTGNKYIYPQIPKIRRKTIRKSSQAAQNSFAESDTNQSFQTQDSLNEICNLLGTLDLQNRTNEQFCEEIENMVDSLNNLTIMEEKQQKTQELSNKFSGEIIMNELDQNLMEIENLREKKKVGIRTMQLSIQSATPSFSLVHSQVRQKLIKNLQIIKSLFKSHLEKITSEALKKIEEILVVGLRELKKSQKALIPLHKVSSIFYELNVKFYRNENVIKYLHRYLIRKIKQCIIDTQETFQSDQWSYTAKINFRLRFFKHLLLESIFYIWTKSAIADFALLLNSSSQKQIKGEKTENQGKENISSTQKAEGPFDNFIV